MLNEFHLSTSILSSVSDSFVVSLFPSLDFCIFSRNSCIREFKESFQFSNLSRQLFKLSISSFKAEYSVKQDIVEIGFKIPSHLKRK